jgi:hypothetical protein
MIPLAIYGFTTAILYKKYYPGEHNGPAIFRPFDAIRKRRSNKKIHKELAAND